MRFIVTAEFDTEAEMVEWVQRHSRPVSRGGSRPGALQVFRKRDLEALAVMASQPNGLTTDDFATALDIERTSLGPILNGWGRRAKKYGVSIDALFDQAPEASIDGRPITRYRLTEFGRKFLERQQALVSSRPTDIVVAVK